MSSQSATVENGACAGAQTRRRRTVQIILAVLLLANVLLITSVALCHPYSRHDIHWSDSVLERLAGQHQVFLESLLLLAPVWLVGSLIARRAPRTGLVAGVTLIALVPILYALEAVAWLTMGLHFFSEKTYQLITSFLPWISVYTQQTNFGPILLALAGFVGLQVMLVFVGRSVARRLQKRAEEDNQDMNRRLPAAKIGVAAALLILPLGWRLRDPGQIFELILKTPDRHPLAATGLFVRDSSGDPEFVGPQETRVATHLVTLEPAVAKFEQDYENVRLVNEPVRRPDVLIILAESLRHDALQPKAAPNLTDFASRSLTSSLHFSAGNASELGFFGLLYGLDPIFFSHSMRRRPAALPKVLREAGYFTAFHGHGDLDLNFIANFVHEDTFDDFSSRNGIPFYERDEEIVAAAQALFERKGQWEKLKDQPVFAMLGLFTTHNEYHYRPQDEVFRPSPRDGLPTPPWTPATRQSVLNRYFNSVHCLDRMIAPLLTDDKVIIVLGDHGESFGDDQRMLHGTALSFTQMRTPLIFHVPGESPRSLPGPTSHEDVLPTLLDTLGMQISSPDLLTGRSLLAEPDPDEEIFSLKATVTGEHALLDYRKPELTPIFRFQLDLWQPAFRLLDANDEHQQPVEWTTQEGLAFEFDLREWLDRRLRVDSGPISQEPLAVLISILESGTERQIEMALGVLHIMGPDAQPAMTAISRHLTSENREIRSRTQALLRNLVSGG